MPVNKTHRYIGFFCAFVVALLLFRNIQWTIQRIFGIPLIIYIYSNLPDLDHWASKIRKQAFTAIFVLLAASLFTFYILGNTITILILTLSGLAGLAVYETTHRGFMHSYLFVILASLPLLFFDYVFFWLGLTAAASHITADRIFSKFKSKIKKL